MTCIAIVACLVIVPFESKAQTHPDEAWVCSVTTSTGNYVYISDIDESDRPGPLDISCTRIYIPILVASHRDLLEPITT